MDPNTGTAADPSEPDVAAGTTTGSGPLAGPRPDLNGLRVAEPGKDPIYLIDDGVRREVESATAGRLFRNGDGVVKDAGVSQIPLGKKIESGALLAKANGIDTVYLVESRSKRQIVNQKTWDRYHFTRMRIYSVPLGVLRAIPDGKKLDFA